MIYLDYAANTPVDKEVLDLYYDYSLKYFANPNSVHKLGLECNKIIEDSSNQILDLFKLKDFEVIYTSGATESNNMAIKGVCEKYKDKGKHIIISPFEHNSIVASVSCMQELGFEFDMLPITDQGKVDLKALENMIREDTILVSVTSVDSELALKQPIEEISKIVSKYPNCLFHTDATQAIGKVEIDFNLVDLVTMSPHKVYGINGVGILLKKKNVSLVPIISGGRSTTVYRSGTPVLPLIASSSFALKKAVNEMENRFNHVSKLNNIVRSHLRKYSNIHINSIENSLPFTLNFSVVGHKSSDIFALFDQKDIYISTKTTCCLPGIPSQIILALTHNKELAESSLRVSFSHLTTEEEVNKFLEVLDSIVGR